MDNRREVIERAVRHYVKRLEDLIGDKDDELKTDLVKSDLLSFAKEVEEQLMDTKDPLEPDHIERRQIRCIALECYLNDLNKSKNVVTKKLPEENRTFKLVDEEIRAVIATREWLQCPNK
jgi:hypothetical protein